MNLITGPDPHQKKYPCNAAKKELAWKGGCWKAMMLSGVTREERVAECKTTVWYEPEPGFCVKTGGIVYTPVPATGEVKPPQTTFESAPPDLPEDPRGYEQPPASQQKVQPKGQSK